jgi:hypothetical protein
MSPISLVRLLNGAVSIDAGQTEVKFGGVIEFQPHGGRIVYGKAEARAKSRAFADAIVIRQDGSVDPPSPTLEQGA